MSTLIIRFWASLVLVLFSSAAFAQSQTYYADDLASMPKTVIVSPGYLTMIEFYQEVDQISSGRPGLMKLEVSGSRVYLSALANSGATDLMVEVGDRAMMFRIDVTKGNSPRRYSIALDRPAQAPKPVAVAKPTPAPVVVPAAPVVTVSRKPAPIIAAPTRTLVASSVVTKVAPTTVKAATPPTAPTTATTAGAPVMNPGWLEMSILARDIDVETGNLTLYFSIKNNGTQRVLLDATNLSLTVQQGNTSIVSAPTSLNGVLSPGSARLGKIVLRGAQSGSFTLKWAMSEISRLRVYVIERSVDIETLALNPRA